MSEQQTKREFLKSIIRVYLTDETAVHALACDFEEQLALSSRPEGPQRCETTQTERRDSHFTPPSNVRKFEPVEPLADEDGWK
jgi:hypothetical protein